MLAILEADKIIAMESSKINISDIFYDLEFLNKRWITQYLKKCLRTRLQI